MQVYNIRNKMIKVSNFEIGIDKPLTVIAGPCQIESLGHAMHMAGELKDICYDMGVNFIYKSSFDKANRTSVKSKRGVGIQKGLEILFAVKQSLLVPTLTDIHESYQADLVSSAGVDVLQIPAFLCRQTDLLLAAGKTGKAINVKKGQFLAPNDMAQVAKKIASTGNENILLCERGSSYGYNNLIVDMRSLPIMASTGYPVVFDCTHSVQQPGGLGTSSGGDRRMVPYLGRAAAATGSLSAVFIETHNDPDRAPSDGPNMVNIQNFRELLEPIVEIHGLMQKRFAKHCELV